MKGEDREVPRLARRNHVEDLERGRLLTGDDGRQRERPLLARRLEDRVRGRADHGGPVEFEDA